MFDIYSNLKEGHYPTRKMEVDELLFAEFTCVKKNDKIAIWSANNYFAFITSGRKKWSSIHYTYEVSHGDILFVKKGASLTHRFADDEFCAVLIFVPDDFIRDVVAKFSLLKMVSPRSLSAQDSIIRITSDKLLDNYCASVQTYLSLPEKPSKALVKLKFEELLLSLFSNRMHDDLTDYFVSLCQNREHLLRGVMEQNFAYNLKLKDYAQLCNMSESTFRRSFERVYKTTPALWIQNRKLELACSKLLSSDLTVDRIAFESGFDESSYFIKLFKKKFNYTPSRFRQNLLKSASSRSKISVHVMN